MLHNKKGLSTIVTTLIIILLVLVAIGIIWVVIRGVIEQGTSQIDINTKCINTDVRATNVTCTGVGTADCVTTLYRKAGNDVIGGVRLVFHNSSGSSSTGVLQYVGDITLLSSQVTGSLGTGIVLPTNGEDSVDVIPYFKDDQGQDRLCTQINPFSF